MVLSGGAAELAEELSGSLEAQATLRAPPLGTAVLEWPAGRIDIAGAPRRGLSGPGRAAHGVPGTPEEDLARRDFTVNALAVALAGPRAGEMLRVEHALEDLAARRLRVLHERGFLDDPTRLLRLARYGARLGFAVERPPPSWPKLPCGAAR